MFYNLYVLYSGQLRGHNSLKDHNTKIFKTISKNQHYFYYLPPEDNIDLGNESSVLLEDKNILNDINNLPNLDGLSTYSVDIKLSETNGYKQHDNLISFKLQWLGVERCFKMAPRDENGLYIRCRPDLKINIFRSEWLKIIKPNNIIIPKEFSYAFGICDKFAMGDYNTMSKYCDFINNAYKCGNGNSENKLEEYFSRNNINTHKKEMGIQLYNKNGSIRIA
jgi:hypothetical protein